MNIIAQIVGVAALLLAVISFQQKTHKCILAFQLAANTAFIIHFALLGAYTGALLNAVAAIRAVVFVNKGKKWADNKAWFWLFCILPVVACVPTWSGWASLFPAAAMVCSTIAFWIKTPKYVRMVSLPGSPLWLIYNIINSSYAGIVTEIFNIISIITAMIRLDFRKKEQ